MSRNTGPCFEFVIRKEGAKVEFVFLPGNVANNIFVATKDSLEDVFNKVYDKGFISKVKLNDGTETIAIDQIKVLGAVKATLDTPALRNFKIKFSGIDKDGNEQEEILNTSADIKKAAALVPYYNKNNNDMTTRRRK